MGGIFEKDRGRVTADELMNDWPLARHEIESQGMHRLQLRKAPVTFTRYPNVQQFSSSTLPFLSSNPSLPVATNMACP